MFDQMGTFLLHQIDRNWWNNCRTCSLSCLLT